MQSLLPSILKGLLALAAGATAAGVGQAQTRPNVMVQLPTFRQFAVSTSVVVPDRGHVALGGVGYSSHGRGRARSAAGLSMSATIIDHHAIDRALLAAAARRRGARANNWRSLEARARDGRNSLAPPHFRRARK